MARVVSIYQRSPLALPDGRIFTAQACGREREGGLWEGWLEFVPHDGSAVLRSQRETTQPNLVDLEYWATGLTPIYLQGALERTLTPLKKNYEPLNPSFRSVGLGFPSRGFHAMGKGHRGANDDFTMRH